MSDSLCDPMDCSPPGSSAHGILQARILEWVGIPSPGDLPDTGMEPGSPAMRADSLPLSYQGFPISELCHFGTDEYTRLGDIYPSLVPQIWFSVHFCNDISSVSLAGLVCLPSWPCLSPPTRSGPSSAFSWELSLLCWQVASDHPTATCPSSICLLSFSHCVNFSGQSHLNSERLTPPGLKTLTFVSKNCFLSFGRYSHQSRSPTDLSLSVVFLSIRSRLLALQT